MTKFTLRFDAAFVRTANQNFTAKQTNLTIIPKFLKKATFRFAYFVLAIKFPIAFSLLLENYFDRTFL